LVVGWVAAIPLLLVRVIWATGGGDAAPLLLTEVCTRLPAYHHRARAYFGTDVAQLTCVQGVDRRVRSALRSASQVRVEYFDDDLADRFWLTKRDEVVGF
jgi:hypothetical protein